ncbi:MAG: Smr/MutS family protein [Treponema sp.]|jgi:DNA mismatch repair protein MutS2|nr:Smr/MutS family protein [Treponema sp.]
MIDKHTLAAKTLSLLEYPQITEKAASFALSEEAAAAIKESSPFYDADEAQEIKTKVLTLYMTIKSAQGEPSSWLPSIGFLLPKIETQGVVLDLDEALAIGLFAERGGELKNWLIKTNDEKEYFAALCAGIPDCAPAAAEIFKIIDREGKLRDIPVLRAIKKRISSLERDLKNAVSLYAGKDDYRRMLQSPLPSQRDGRTVLAVKSNFRGRISGIVHEVSSSGQTIFVEPLEVVEKNNEILIEKRNLDAEIHKILRELTGKIAANAENLKQFHRAVIELECLRARAKYSASIKGHFTLLKNPQDDTESLVLKQARHPLLKKAVPIDIEMKSVTRTLIITGPNTGGKTVALKTLGLFAMMNQSGLALPLDEGSVLPFFDGIYADIGDEQSIDQSLSTFSAHITNVSAIASCATENSLVLLDELGSGTDPQEGGALAMAILDFLIARNSRMIITTHHGILKNYGYTRQGVENASVEFDARTLSPTYRIINGVPGESRALDIASANGLDARIVEKARNYINEEKSDISALITGLEQKHKELASAEKNSEIQRKKLNEEIRKADLKELQLRQKEAELKRESVGKLQVFLRESRKTLENLVRELKEGEVDREKTLKVKEFLNDLAHNAEKESAALEEEESEIAVQFQIAHQTGAENAATGQFCAGMEVFAGPSKQRGVIVRSGKKSAASGGCTPAGCASGNTWVVKIGSLKMTFAQGELIPAAQKNAPARESASWAAEFNSGSGASDRRGAVFELKLIGMRLDEATDALRRQIEAASLNGLKTFSVIHGKGSGILQKGIHEYLKKDSAVEDYYFSRPEMGGFGRTEVVLK